MLDNFRMKLRVALLGAGNVTRAFLSYWAERDFGIDLRVVSVVRQRGIWHGDQSAAVNLDELSYQTELDSFNNAQLVIEAFPSVYPHGEPATSMLRNALEQKIDVLTVDKGPLVAAYRDLSNAARRSGARLKFCVGGALPAIDVALRDLRGTTIRGIRTILNGTTNFILSEMHARSCAVGEALEIAISRGIAEPDPSQDIDGIDSAAKMVILVNAVLNTDIRLDQVRTQGIRNVTLGDARQTGKVWKLIGTYANGMVSVTPELVALDDIFSRINGTDKIAEFDTVEMGKLAIVGGASGRMQMGATMTKEILNLYLPSA
jgi:homoserine dehydrogenase